MTQHYDEADQMKKEVERARGELKDKIDSLSYVEINFILKIIPRLKDIMSSLKLFKELLKAL